MPEARVAPCSVVPRASVAQPGPSSGSEQRRAGRSRSARVALGVVVATLLVAGAVGTLLSPLFALHRIAVVVQPASSSPGPGVPTGAELARQSGLALGTPLVELCGSCARARLDRLPDVRSASVRRRWPNGAVVEVALRTPVAAVTLARGFALIDRAGRILAVVERPPAGLVRMAGSATEGLAAPGALGSAALRWGAAVAAALPPSVRAVVAAVDVETSGQVTLRLQEGTRVELGYSGILGQKMEAIATVLARVPLAGVATVDVTVPSEPVLQPA